MVYIVLNILVALIFVFFTVYTDKFLQKEAKNVNALLPSLLVVSIEAIFFFIILLVNHFANKSYTKVLLRCAFFLDGAFFIVLSYSIITLATERYRTLLRFIELILFAFVIYVETQITDIYVTDRMFYCIQTKPLFYGSLYDYFKYDWVSGFNFVLKIFVPVISYIFLMLIYEKNGTQLQRYQGFVIGEGLLLLWVVRFFFDFMSEANPGYTCLFLYEYLVMFFVFVYALKTTSIPSGKSLFANFIKVLVTYIIPGLVVAGVVMFAQPVTQRGYPTSFVLEFVGIAICAIYLSTKLSKIFNSSTKLYTSDYGPALEKDLAKIDYSEEMDEIIGKMYSIFRKNVETSSMNVYIADNKGSLSVAYSSNGITKEISLSDPIFDVLLNNNKSVVVYSEVGNVHIISSIEDKLKQFFEDTKSDALFVLNEGRNILGLITLGKKVTGDHFKEYDYSVFTKLYSYFFVFGYYMRNISNKEIISIVNREIKMSSQIITSIQENIDHIKNSKVDTGYLMVPAHNIGGEFIDLIRLTDTRHLFVVGDLSGKGIAASMNMVILKSIIRTYLAETHDFKQLVLKINDFIRTSLRKGTIFAGLFALIDFETDTMYYINCGIPALMLYTQVYNNVIEIQGSGHILGFAKDLAPFISVKTTKLNRGDIILACTDGLVQSHSLRGEQFGKERIQQCILDNSTYPAQRMVQFTFENLTKFMSKEMEDDVSILVLKYESTAEFVEESANQDWNEITANNDIKAAIDSINAKKMMDEEKETTETTKISDEVQSVADQITADTMSYMDGSQQKVDSILEVQDAEETVITPDLFEKPEMPAADENAIVADSFDLPDEINLDDIKNQDSDNKDDSDLVLDNFDDMFKN